MSTLPLEAGHADVRRLLAALTALRSVIEGARLVIEDSLGIIGWEPLDGFVLRGDPAALAVPPRAPPGGVREETMVEVVLGLEVRAHGGRQASDAPSHLAGWRQDRGFGVPDWATACEGPIPDPRPPSRAAPAQAGGKDPKPRQSE
jgi:hypothetical protein